MSTGTEEAPPARQWWHMPLIPALRRQRQVNFWVWGQPGLQTGQTGLNRETLSWKTKKKEKKKKKKRKREKGPPVGWKGENVWGSSYA
jgi:hypothetical protein